MRVVRGGLAARMVPLRRALQRARTPPRTRRVILHIGAHKTGSTSLQYLLEANHLRLPRGYDVIRRNEAPLFALKRQTYGMKSAEGAARAASMMPGIAQALAEATPWAAVTLISHEDIVGHMPTRGGVRGLYPFAAKALRAILQGFDAAGVETEVVFYTRDWDDWKTSVFLWKNPGASEDGYSPGYQRRAHGLPGGWDGLLADLREAAGTHPFHHIRFEDDRAAGLMGLGYLQAAGLSPSQIARLRRVPPRNVTRPGTVRPEAADRSPAGS